MFGDSFLANNPHFEGDSTPYSYRLAHVPAGSAMGQVLQKESRQLWEVYQHLPEQLEPRSLLDAINQPCEKLGFENGDVSSFIRGLSQSIPSHAAMKNDIFAETQAYACCIVSLLAFLNSDDEAQDTILGLIHQLSDLLQNTLEKTYEAIDADTFAVLSTRGGLNDLFVLPVRISRILGWAAAHTHICNKLGINENESEAIFEKITHIVIDKYLNAVVSVSDAQSPYTSGHRF